MFPGECMSVDVSPVNYSDSVSVLTIDLPQRKSLFFLFYFLFFINTSFFSFFIYHRNLKLYRYHMKNK